MSDEMRLVADLAVILIAAGIFTVISKALKQPLILGYIIAGFLVGPKLGLFPGLVSGMDNIHQWSEIGIIFLLFGLGLEFSLKKLLKVGSAALITAGTICIGMFIVGMSTGSLLGWSSMESTFLGGMLSMSSTTIIIKAYTDMGLKNRPYATLIFGTLVVEDLIAVLMMVLLSTLAVSQKFAGSEMLFGLLKLLFFLILCFLVGIFVLPTLLKKAKRFLSDEILLIASIGLCFGMVSLASYLGFSSALGAFVMGSILAETMEGERISKLTSGIKDLFGAVFFVSVGMMVDPAVIGQQWSTILILALVAVGGILIFSTAGSLLSGQGLDTSVHVGFSLAQLGEFSFIIAGVGMNLGVLRDFIYPVVIATSVLTTFTTPYMIKAAEPASAFLGSHLSPKLLAKLNRQQDKKSSGLKEQSEWMSLVKVYVLRVVIYSVVLVAIYLSAKSFLYPLADSLLPGVSADLRHIIRVAATLIIMLPFLYSLGVANGQKQKQCVVELVNKNSKNKVPIFAMLVFRMFIASLFIIFVLLDNFELKSWSILLIGVLALVAFMLIRMFNHQITPLEKRFFSNFNEKESLERKNAPIRTSVREMLGEYDISTHVFKIAPESPFAGHKLVELPFRSDFGLNVVSIKRGKLAIDIPSPMEPVYPADSLVLVGTDEQFENFSKAMTEIENSVTEASLSENEQVTVERITVEKDSFLYGKCLKDSRMKEYKCLLISLLPAGSEGVVPNPPATYRFAENDVVWIAGHHSDIELFKK